MYQIHGPVSTAGGWSLKFPPMLSLSPSMIEPLMSPGPASSKRVFWRAFQRKRPSLATLAPAGLPRPGHRTEEQKFSHECARQ
jgi:hypothetical protein